MAVRNAGRYRQQHIYGVSNDDKLTTAVYIGDKHTDIDSSEEYLYAGEGLGWKLKTPVIDLSKFRYNGVPMAVDHDGAIVISDLHEYYFDNGAFFQTSSLTPDSVSGQSGDNPGVQYYEITNSVTQLRMFSYFISTLSNRYSFSVYEVPSRELSEITHDVVQLPILIPNRINKKVLPVKIFKLTQSGDSIYQNIDSVGELLKTKTYLLQADSSSPHTMDSGVVDSSQTAIRMDNENYNYVLCIKNHDSATRDFFLSMSFGVVEFLPTL